MLLLNPAPKRITMKSTFLTLSLLFLLSLTSYAQWPANKSLFDKSNETQKKSEEKELSSTVSPAKVVIPPEEIARLEKEAQDKPTFIEAHFQLGNAYLKNGTNDKALAEFKKTIELDPKFQPSYIQLGALYLSQQNSKDAIPVLLKATELKSTDPLGWYNLGIAYEMSGDTETAIKTYQKAISVDPKDPSSYYNLALLYSKKNRFEEAELALRKAIGAEPNSPDAYYALGTVYDATDRPQKAEEAFLKARDLGLNTLQLNLSIASTFVAQQKYSSALAEYSYALKKDPNNLIALTGSAFVYDKLGNIEKLFEFSDKAVKVDPKSAEAQYQLGKALAYRGKNDEAEKALRTALSLDNELVDVHVELGNILESSGKVQAAITEYELTLKKVPNHGIAHYRLGRAMNAAGQSATAKIHLEQACTLKVEQACATLGKPMPGTQPRAISSTPASEVLVQPTIEEKTKDETTSEENPDEDNEKDKEKVPAPAPTPAPIENAPEKTN